MYSITGVISEYRPRAGKVTLKVYDELNGKELKSSANEWITVSVDNDISLKVGDQVKAQISDDKKKLSGVSKLTSSKHDSFKSFFIGLSLKGTSMKDRIRLFNAFGIDVLKLAKDRLPLLINNAQKYGYSMQSAVLIKSKAERIKNLYSANKKLSNAGFSGDEIKYLSEKFGTSLGNVVVENPYMLLAGGFSRFSSPFSNSGKEKAMLARVDSLVDNASLPKWQSSRNFYVMEMIVRRLESQGSTAFAMSDVNDQLSEVLGIDYTDAKDILDMTLSSKGYKQIDAGNDGYFITPARNYNVEESVAQKLLERMRTEDTKVTSRDLIFEDFYTDEQRQSIKLAMMKNLLVVTGGAGTGKTTVVKGIIQNIKKVFGKQSGIMLCAPTGKAAQRMSEATSLEARTLHSMLRFNPEKGFMEADIPADTKILIIDEASMIDSSLMLRLLDNIPSTTKIVFVGDVQQILPVNPGQPFKDMILSDFLPTVRLSVPQRTGNKSHIYLNANKVINGIMPTLNNQDMEDFHFTPTRSDGETLNEILRILAEDVEGVYRSSLSNVQVISPKRDPSGEVGMTGLNRQIQKLLNSEAQDNSGDKKGRSNFYVGDKVVFNRNDYKLKLFNGDVGYITEKDDEHGSLKINVDGKEFSLTRDKVKGLELANALSAHKTQGSEYDIVIMPLSKRHSHMLSPELLYTAITRAKKHFIFVGDQGVIRSALKNVNLNKRDTYLKARLIATKMEMENARVVESSGSLDKIDDQSSLSKQRDSQGVNNVRNDTITNREVVSHKQEEEFDWQFDL